VKQHYKHIQSNKDKRERKKTTHQYCLLSSVQKITYSKGESNSPFHFEKRDTKRLQEISLKVHKEQTLISTHFSSHPHSQ